MARRVGREQRRRLRLECQNSAQNLPAKLFVSEQSRKIPPLGVAHAQPSTNRHSTSAPVAKKCRRLREGPGAAGAARRRYAREAGSARKGFLGLVLVRRRGPGQRRSVGEPLLGVVGSAYITNADRANADGANDDAIVHQLGWRWYDSPVNIGIDGLFEHRRMAR